MAMAQYISIQASPLCGAKMCPKNASLVIAQSVVSGQVQQVPSQAAVVQHGYNSESIKISWAAKADLTRSQACQNTMLKMKAPS